jgi:aminocarboxymuconate-semialdehyde decarboxylase
VAAADRLSQYYLGNLLGNPLDTSIAIASLVFSGVFERHSSLCMCFAHGGGYIPYQRGRLDHGWRVRPEPKQRMQGPPSESVKRLYFDSIVHFPPALDYLVRTQGADHVLMGSDYPFDMGPENPVAAVEEGITDAVDRATVLGASAARLLGIGSATG